MKNKFKAFDLANTIFLFIFVVICLYPFYYVLISSFSDSYKLITKGGLLLYPVGFNINAYIAVFKNPAILQGYQNTLFILVVGVIFNLLLTSLAAYVLARKGVFWNKAIMIFIVITMYFQGGLVPNYLNIQDLGLYNTIWSLIFPVAINTFNLIIMRTGFMGIPETLYEAADLDGANDYYILFNIVIPLSMPIIAVIALYYGVAHWNSWFQATMYIRDKSILPLQVILREILILNETSSMESGDSAINIGETIKSATIIVSTLPILFIYPFLQRYFVKGIMVGAVKG